MMRSTPRALAPNLSPNICDPGNAERITANLSAEISEQLHRVAERCRVSESALVEIALRDLFRRVGPDALSTFLRERGGCLRRRRS